MIATNANDIRLFLPKPYPLQLEIMRSPAKRKVICAGRRAGKTTTAALIAVEQFLLGKKVLLTSTTQDQADAFWDKVKKWLQPLIQKKIVYKNEVRRILECGALGNARIRVKTGGEPDVLRGDDADLIVFDECALLDPDAWFAVGAPMLADRDGTAVFISTPRRRNWFYHLYQKALDENDERWAAWHFSSHMNPHLSKIAIAELAADMTEDMYKQEIMAEFLEGSGQVFRNIRQAAILQKALPNGQRTVAGLDWAQIDDYTVMMILDGQTGDMLDYDRFKGVSWELQRGRIRTMYDRWRPEKIIGEVNSIGAPNIEALIREGLPIEPFTTTATSKPPLIEGLILAFERNQIRLLQDEIVINEFEAYEREVSKQTGYSKFSAPSGLHDDVVMATALAYKAVRGGVRKSFVVW